jgi:hypothetical protein
MANRIKDRTGKTYGQLKALRISSRRKGVIYWLMECVHCKEQREVRSPGMRNTLRCKKCGFRKNLVGTRSGALTVTAFSHSENWKAYWRVLCDCGAERILPTTSLTGAKAQISCGPSCKKRLLDDETRVKRKKLLSYKNGARTRNLEWEIADDEAWGLMQSNCYWCGDPPLVTTFWSGDRKTRTATWPVNGIDRLESGIGYVEGNCVACCSKCNRAKADLTKKQFLAHVQTVLIHQARM